MNLSVWCYTGYAYEDLICNENARQFLSYADVLVDGKFIESQRDLTLRFRGSKNQRLIDVPKSFAQNRVVELKEYCINSISIS